MDKRPFSFGCQDHTRPERSSSNSEELEYAGSVHGAEAEENTFGCTWQRVLCAGLLSQCLLLH